jgi:hypothetical protein
MCERDLGIRELRSGVRIAVQREDAPRFEGARRHRVIEVLARGITVNLDRDASLRGRRKYDFPVRYQARARSCDPTARVRKNPDRRVRNYRYHAVRLILVPSEPRVWRGQHHVETGRLLVGQIQRSSGVDVRFYPLEQPELLSEVSVDVVDGAPLMGSFGHRHPPGDFQSV